jgi:hypothetical protein
MHSAAQVGYTEFYQQLRSAFKTLPPKDRVRDAVDDTMVHRVGQLLSVSSGYCADTRKRVDQMFGAISGLAHMQLEDFEEFFPDALDMTCGLRMLPSVCLSDNLRMTKAPRCTFDLASDTRPFLLPLLFHQQWQLYVYDRQGHWLHNIHPTNAATNKGVSTVTSCPIGCAILTNILYRSFSNGFLAQESHLEDQQLNSIPNKLEVLDSRYMNAPLLTAQ